MAQTVNFKGNPVALSGSGLKVGDTVPTTQLVGNDLSTVSLPSGKVTVVVVVPSLDTGVCDTEGRRFNQEATSLPGDVQVVIVSRDLPFAQKRWCGAAGIENVKTLSDFRGGTFGQATGLEMVEGPLAGVLARAVYVVDRSGKVTYAELVPEVTQEPNYDAALAAAKSAAMAAV